MDRILVIDDELANLIIAERMLKRNGFKVSTLQNPIDTLSVAKSCSPSLLLLDWHMPIISGIEVLRDLKKDSAVREIPVIMTTGINTDQESLKLAFEAGANDFLRKPLNETELISRILSLLRTFKYFRSNRDKLGLIHANEKDQITRELEKKKEDLVLKTLQVLKNTEITEKLINELKPLSENPKYKFSDMVNNIISKYSGNTTQMRWQNFEKHFSDLNQEFYKNLLKSHPDLTPNERKLCALFRMDLNSKDIALVTFATYESVRKARTRLRKKLMLDLKTDLVVYLHNF